MKMDYENGLIMPKSYSIMNEETMTYVEGGVNIGMCRGYLNKTYCASVAKYFIDQYGWKNISVDNLKKEIYGHAYAYYNWKFLKALPWYSNGEWSSVYSHVANGVDIANATDRFQSAWNKIWNNF